MSLKKLQQDFQQAVIHTVNTVDAVICAPENLSSIDALQIYQNGYVERITQAMMQDYPVLCHCIGEDAFASMITDYLKDYPSSHYNLRFVGQHLSRFILSKNSDFIAYSELARLEWMVCDLQLSADDDQTEKEFETAFNVVEVWEGFQQGRIIALEVFSNTRSYCIRS